MEARTVYTIGYEGFDPETFLWKLQLDRIEVVADVRDSPRSRNPGFNQARIRGFLESHGLTYTHFPALGAPASLRAQLRLDRDLECYLASYREHLAGQAAALDELARLVESRTVCLLCLERDPQECHRSVLAEALQRLSEGKLAIQHI